MKGNRKKLDTNKNYRESDVLDWKKWRGVIRIACNSLEEKRIQHYAVEVCQKETIGTANNREHWMCIPCDRVLSSKATYENRMRS